jgi:hypothetical protein
VNEEDGNGALMGDVNWALWDFGGKGRGAKRGWVGVGGCPSFRPPVSQKLGPREKLPFEPQSTAYSSKPCLAISLIIS